MTATINSVLIVDDDPIMRARVVAFFSARHHITVHEAEDGVAALRTIAARPDEFDLILCDLNMPEKDGIELLDSLAKSRYRGAIAIVSCEQEFNIAMADILARESGLNLIASLKKPLSNERLEQLIAELAGAPQSSAMRG